MKIIKTQQEDDYIIVWVDEVEGLGVHIHLDEFKNDDEFKELVKEKFNMEKEKRTKEKEKKEKDYKKFIGVEL